METHYQVRIERVIDYIYKNLDKKISLSDVANVSHFSEFHFHRIFTGIMGETVNDYMVRKRLERAINRLISCPNLSVTQLALSNGFSSSANFSKAVKNYFGFSPSQIRNPEKIKNSKIGKILSKYGKDFNPNDLYPDKVINKVTKTSSLRDSDMNVEIINRESQTVCVLASEAGYDPEAIFEAWDKLIAWVSAQGISESEQKRFAFCYDNPAITPIDRCVYKASIVIDSTKVVKPPFSQSVIPEGKYAKFHFKGNPEESNNAKNSFYSDWLPSSGFEPDSFPILEHYLNDVRVDGYVEMVNYIKLKELI